MKKSIVSFGEIVWDQFKDASILGGAPLNVAYHLYAAGWPVHIVSRIGDDGLGRETLQQIKQLGLTVTTIQQDPDLPTGRVLVSLDADNEPSFEIAAPAAWDNIEAEPVLCQMEDTPFHLVFGTLAQRSETSRSSLHRLLEKADIKFYDVNLRPPYTKPELVLASLKAANVVKVNREELMSLADWFMKGKKGVVEDIGRELLVAFDLSLLAVTDGDKGAQLITRDERVEHKGFQVKVIDPVGSGDAFFAALINGYLGGLSLDECLQQANRQGAWVASQQGATPLYPGKGI
ncbi:MAG: carbohydrate kinase [Proteobacteria bacterium]|nr:carbohydrate kinase [Pseudomonadota bacterium]MBU1231533.1 carbohydrate kinase [Pseudomonadota bacterium]MBU1417527.1 carbohydrate kinase [Pseudomonadota bacterium]MBU1453493.1 carbohydrate kinase [Pseudomonadota bacterium]